MLTSLEHFTVGVGVAFDSGIEALVRVINPEMIICYGSRVRMVSAWSPFSGDALPVIQGEYDLLIIQREADRRRDHEIIDLIECRNTDSLLLTAIVHRLSAVRDALQRNSLFFTTVYRQGVLVYGDAEQLVVVLPVLPIMPDATSLRRQWDRWFGLSRNFLSVATDSAARGWHAVAVFMLHQAVEHACIAIVRVCMGYRPATHNLTRLLRLVENFAAQISDIFPCFTEEERALFNVLQRAYSEARYREVYIVSPEDTAILIRRVNALHAMVETFYFKKLNALDV